MPQSGNQARVNTVAALAGAALSARSVCNRRLAPCARAQELLVLGAIGVALTYALGGRGAALHFVRGMAGVLQPAA